jgi:hypothetical protein
VWITASTPNTRKALMPHRNAPLTETGRLRLVRCVVDSRWPVRRAAERFQVSHTTAVRWPTLYRGAAAAGMPGHHLGHGTPTPLAGQHIRAVTVHPARNCRHARVNLRTGPGRSSALPVGVSAARTTMRV